VVQDGLALTILLVPMCTVAALAALRVASISARTLADNVKGPVKENVWPLPLTRRLQVHESLRVSAGLGSFNIVLCKL
jgi:hypothetical protein